MAASAGYPFPEAEWIEPTASKEAAQGFVRNYLSWTLQRSFNDSKVVRFAKRFTHSASFLYDADEQQFQELFGDDLGSRFHHHMNYRSPYGHAANMKKHLTSYTSSASGYYAKLAHLIEQSSHAPVAKQNNKKNDNNKKKKKKKLGSVGSTSSSFSSHDDEDGDVVELPPMPSPPASVYQIGRMRRRTADYVIDELKPVGSPNKSFF
ncbi:hypothetical protein KEM54_003788 [Ascosphaera aggregata]|nr:hypothetical protein KEM54_003788 [Ascosphaera aggregata]